VRDAALAHALAVFGGAIGLVLIVGAVAFGIRNAAGVRGGCDRCVLVIACAAAAFLVGAWLVRGAVRAMREDE
jgi:hypothetical protein